MSRKETSVHTVPDMSHIKEVKGPNLSPLEILALRNEDKAERARKGLGPRRTSSATNEMPGSFTMPRKPRAIMPKEAPSKTGTYAIRNGEFVKISERADGVEDHSSKLNGERVVQWTELPRAINPAKKAWKKWKKVGAVQFPIFDGDGDRRKYQQICRDVGEPRAWVK